MQARAALRNDEEGPLVRVTLLDCGRYAGKATIGVSTLALKDMLHLPEHGIVHNCPLSANFSAVTQRDQIAVLQFLDSYCRMIKPGYTSNSITSTSIVHAFPGTKKPVHLLFLVLTPLYMCCYYTRVPSSSL